MSERRGENIYEHVLLLLPPPNGLIFSLCFFFFVVVVVEASDVFKLKTAEKFHADNTMNDYGFRSCVCSFAHLT